jgi:hypothetical protein
LDDSRGVPEFVFTGPFIVPSHLAYDPFRISPIIAGWMANRMYATPGLDAPFVTQLENDKIWGSMIDFDDGEISYFVIFIQMRFIHISGTQLLSSGRLQHDPDVFSTSNNMPIRQDLPCLVQYDAGPQSIIHENDPWSSLVEDASTDPSAQDWLPCRRECECEFRVS